MSCCIGFNLGNSILVAVDGRTSFTYNGAKYRIEENTKKYIVNNNELIVTFGNSDVVEIFKKNCTDYQNKSIDEIFDMSLTSNRIEEYLHDDIQKQTLLLSVYRFNISEKKIEEIFFDTNGKNTLSVPLYDYFCFGFNSDEISEFISKKIIGKHTNIYEAFQILFDEFNSPEIGGCWTIFKIIGKKIAVQGTYNSSIDNIPSASNWLVEEIRNNVQKHIEKYRCYQVKSPQIKGNFILGGEISGGSFWDDSKISCLKLSSNDDKFADLTFAKNNGNELFKIYDAIDYVSMYLNGANIGHVGSNKTFYPDGKWNFSGAEITGLKLTFG